MNKANAARSSLGSPAGPKSATLKGRVGWGVGRASRRLYPNYVSETDLFAETTALYLKKDSAVLDAGCGRGEGFRYPWKRSVRHLVGADLTPQVGSNPNTTSSVRADLACLPFASGSFGVIFARYVLEHVRDPASVFKEFGRVLKPGGRLIVLTPSKYHYVSLLSRLTPHWFHEKVAALRGNPACVVFPTRYAANSRSELEGCARQAGMQLEKFISREARPNYLLWFLPIFLLGVVYERLVNRFSFLSPLRVNIVAVFLRPL